MPDLHHRVHGEGRPVVFLHGFLESMSMWLHTGFVPGVRAIWIDLPGHGASSLEEFPYQYMSDVAAYVSATIDSIGVDKYDVVGHSMGGYVGLELKAKDNRCNKVILLNSNFWTDPEEKKQDRKRVADLVIDHSRMFIREAIPGLFYQPENYQEAIQFQISESLGMIPDAIACASVAMSQRNDYSDMVANQPERFEIIQGEFDATVPLEMMQQKLESINLDMHTIRGAGHMSHIEASEEVGRLLTELLNP